MVYERLLQCMWRGMRGFDFSGIHAGMPLLFSGDLSGGTAVGRFRTGFSGTAGRGFFSFLVVGRGCLPDRGRKVGSSKKHICKKGEAFSRGGANRKAGIHTGSISGMGGLSAWTVTEGKR